MTNLILYKQDGGRVSVVHPTADALKKYPIREIALRSVPKGKPYKIIGVSELPADRAQRDAWTVSETELTDGIGGAE